MIASRVIPPTEVEGMEVDGVGGVGGATIPDHHDRNCASLHLMVVASMAHITEKWLETEKEQKNGVKSA